MTTTTKIINTLNYTSDHTGFISSYSEQNTDIIYIGNQTLNMTTKTNKNSNVAVIVSVSVVSFVFISVGAIMFKKHILKYVIKKKSKDRDVEMY